MQALAAGKQATALLETTNEDASGTAFCVDPSGLFVTNDHVAEEAVNQKMTLVLHPGEANQKTLIAHVLRTDKDDDLALLKVDGVAGLTSLPLGRDNGLLETDSVTAFGYPFGKDLALSDKSAPSITVSVGRITALRRDKEGLQFIQLDASLNPGNSGGPVLDANGKIVGVVEAGVPGAALNFAIPVHLLTKFLQTPSIFFAPSVAPGTETQVHAFYICVLPLLPNTGPFTVTLTLNAPGQAPRSFTAHPAESATDRQATDRQATDRQATDRQATDGQATDHQAAFLVSAAPIPPPAGPKRLRLTAQSPRGTLVGEVSDQGIDIAGQRLNLSQARAIRLTHGGMATADLVGGQHVTGKLVGLDAVQTAVAGEAQVINFTRYPMVLVTEAASPPSHVDYQITVQITVRHRAKVVGQQSGTLWLGMGVNHGGTALGTNSITNGNPTTNEIASLNTGAPASGGDAPPVRDPQNDHWYQAVSVPGGLHWLDAKKRAEAMIYQGRRGHLVTLTSAAEAQWVVDHFPDAVKASYWLGGFQNPAAPDYREPDGGWQWVTGEPWSFTRWNHGLYQEPNDAPPGHEDYLTFAGEGNWNDTRADTDISGFVVEYE